MRYAVVRVALANGKRHPALIVTYKQDDDGHGYDGQCSTWPDDRAPSCEHTLSVRQSAPLGSIVVMLDANPAGSWATGEFEGAGIAERDLQWAALWAAQAIKDRHGRVGACANTD
jgi:hypothetical protein